MCKAGQRNSFHAYRAPGIDKESQDSPDLLANYVSATSSLFFSITCFDFYFIYVFCDPADADSTA